jgi:hypothetical protein
MCATREAGGVLDLPPFRLDLAGVRLLRADEPVDLLLLIVFGTLAFSNGVKALAA